MAYGLIKIGALNVRKKDNCFNLITDVSDNGVAKELFFTVDIRYAEYLTTERSDAFVTALLYYAMFKGYDIQWKIPCTEQLIYQLATYYIPICAKEIPFMHPISLIGETTSEVLQCKGGVGTGFSGGGRFLLYDKKASGNSLYRKQINTFIIYELFYCGFL